MTSSANMNDRFRESASFLSRLAKEMPDEFLEGIYARTNLQPGQRLLEIGCGSGDVAAWFSRKGVMVDGVDLSAAMIELAREQFPFLAAHFHRREAVEFMLAASTPWDVIVSFESLHICLGLPLMPSALKNALRSGGFLVVAWRSLEWEAPCRDTVVDLFRICGIPFDDWGFWTCPALADVLARSGLQLCWRTPHTVHVEHSSTVQDVVEFMMGVDRVQDLSEPRRASLRRLLSDRIMALSEGIPFTGLATYSATTVQLIENNQGHAA